MGIFIFFKCSNSNVFLTYFFKCFNNDEMNSCILFLVFLCGVIFASVISFLKSYKFFDKCDGLFSAGTELALMDDGYIAMAQLGLGSTKDCVSRSADLDMLTNPVQTRKTGLEERNSEVEAMNSLKAALELVAVGKKARAGRLLEHAHSLAPKHHDILISYGEYLEDHKDDIVQADHLYLRALTISPKSSKALRNRRRTQPLVEKIDSSVLTRIENKRDELALIPLSSGPLRRIQREAYFQHIYHTASIEGNTLTLAQIRMILETGLSVGGKSVLEHNEVLGIDLALKYINRTLIHRIGRITLQDILEIHRRVLGHVDPLGAGTLRTTQVFVSNHAPPAPTDLESLLEGFLSWLNSPDTQKMHPIKYAALAHYKLVFIHPFVDGNGRTARLLMNFLLMQAGYPPVIIRKQDRLQYYEYLQTANDGDTRPFVRFVAHCMEKMIEVYLWATKDHFPEIEQMGSKEFSRKAQNEPIPSTGKTKLNAVAFLNRAGVHEDFAADRNNGFVLDQTSYPESAKNDLNNYKDDIIDQGYESEPHEWLAVARPKIELQEDYVNILDDRGVYDTVQEVVSIRNVIESKKYDPAKEKSWDNQSKDSEFRLTD